MEKIQYREMVVNKDLDETLCNFISSTFDPSDYQDYIDYNDHRRVFGGTVLADSLSSFFGDEKSKPKWSKDKGVVTKDGMALPYRRGMCNVFFNVTTLVDMKCHMDAPLTYLIKDAIALSVGRSIKYVRTAEIRCKIHKGLVEDNDSREGLGVAIKLGGWIDIRLKHGGLYVDG